LSALVDGGPAAPVASPKRALRWLRVLLTLVVCGWAWAWLLRHADLHTLAGQLARLPAWAWLAAAIGLVGGHGLRAVRLQRDWQHLEPVSWARCLRIVLAHNAMVLMLPLRTGEAAYVVAVRRQWGVPWGAAALALLRWRVQDATVLGLLALALLVPFEWPIRVLLVAAASVLLLMAVPPLWRWWQARRGVTPSALTPRPWSGLGASAGNWTLKVLANGGLLAALAGLPIETAWRAALGGELAGVQPLQPPAGLGTYEGGIWLAAGLPPGHAGSLVAAALAVHAFSLAVALVSAALVQLAVPAPAARERACP
jgi:hypothetical protein